MHNQAVRQWPNEWSDRKKQYASLFPPKPTDKKYDDFNLEFSKCFLAKISDEIDIVALFSELEHKIISFLDTLGFNTNQYDQDKVITNFKAFYDIQNEIVKILNAENLFPNETNVENLINFYPFIFPNLYHEKYINILWILANSRGHLASISTTFIGSVISVKKFPVPDLKKLVSASYLENISTHIVQIEKAIEQATSGYRIAFADQKDEFIYEHELYISIGSSQQVLLSYRFKDKVIKKSITEHLTLEEIKSITAFFSNPDSELEPQAIPASVGQKCQHIAEKLDFKMEKKVSDIDFKEEKIKRSIIQFIIVPKIKHLLESHQQFLETLLSEDMDIRAIKILLTECNKEQSQYVKKRQLKEDKREISVIFIGGHYILNGQKAQIYDELVSIKKLQIELEKIKDNQDNNNSVQAFKTVFALERNIFERSELKESRDL